MRKISDRNCKKQTCRPRICHIARLDVAKPRSSRESNYLDVRTGETTILRFPGCRMQVGHREVARKSCELSQARRPVRSSNGTMVLFAPLLIIDENDDDRKIERKFSNTPLQKKKKIYIYIYTLDQGCHTMKKSAQL